MIPHHLIEKLHDFEDKFPDKTLIKLSNAKKYLSSVIGKEISDEHIRLYLTAKGYKTIIEIPDTKPDMDLDDILNLDWSLKKNEQTSAQSQGAFSRNAHLLKEFNFGDKTNGFERLVVENTRLVHKIASKYQNYINHQLSYEDLVSEGTIGLMMAVHRFDITKDVQFSTYAVWWIRQKIIRAIFDTGTTVRIPVHMIESVIKVKRAELAYLLKGEIPIVKEICSELGMEVSAYEKIKLVEHRFLSITSLDQFVSMDDQETEIGDFVSMETHHIIGGYHPEFLNPSLLSEQQDVRDRIMQIITDHLKPREQEVILERFGFYDDAPKTLERVGEKFGVTRERIRQIEAKAIRKLRARMTRMSVHDDFRWPDHNVGG